MSFTERKETDRRDDEFNYLSDRKDKIVTEVQGWIPRATALHSATSDAGEKAEVIALRDAMIAELQAALT